MAIDKFIIRKEFIGRRLRIIRSPNQELVGKCGTIIDETKNSFIIKENNKKRRVQKKMIIFILDEKYQIRGTDIIRRPEDRIKIHGE